MFNQSIEILNIIVSEITLKYKGGGVTFLGVGRFLNFRGKKKKK